MRCMEKFFTTEEAAAELGVSSARARQLIRAGVLKARQFGRAYVVTAAAITEARQRHSKPGPVPKAKPEQSSGKKRGKK
jgi:excisionase family DNA binding protein